MEMEFIMEKFYRESIVNYKWKRPWFKTDKSHWDILTENNCEPMQVTNANACSLFLPDTVFPEPEKKKDKNQFACFEVSLSREPW